MISLILLQSNKKKPLSLRTPYLSFYLAVPVSIAALPTQGVRTQYESSIGCYYGRVSFFRVREETDVWCHTMGETLLYLSNSEPGPYYGTPQSEYEWSFPPALLVLIFILVAKFFYFRSHQNHTPNSNSSSNHSTRSNNKDDDDGDGDGKLSSFQSKMIAWWKDGLYIQFTARPTISEMMKESTDEIDASFDMNQKGIDTILSSRKTINHLINTNTNRVIGPGCVVKESDIRSYYYGNSNNNNTNTRTEHHDDEEHECCHDDDCGNDLLRRSCEDDDDGNVEMVSTIRQRLATASTATTRSTTTTTKSARSTGTAHTTKRQTARTNTTYNRNVDDKVVFVLRLSLGLLATGHCTVDVETTALKVAAALQLPAPRLSVGHRLFQASFGNIIGTNKSSPTHLLTCKRDFVFSTLKELQLLADAVVTGEIPPRQITIALYTLNKILEAPLPYGWIIYDLVFVGIGPWATIAAYYGSYYDMVGACLLSPVTVFSYRLCEYYQISHLEEIVVPFMIGLLTPLVWRYTNGGQDLCHITPMYMGALLIHLPGAEIVWGVLEILQGSVVHGASRLVKGLISAICLAVFVTLGFQVFGRNLAQNWLLERDNDFQNTTIGAVASLPDSQWCSEVKEPYYPEYFNWYFIIGVYNIPLNILCLMNVYIPIRDFVVRIRIINSTLHLIHCTDSSTLCTHKWETYTVCLCKPLFVSLLLCYTGILAP